jgi:hypothetical protein
MLGNMEESQQGLLRQKPDPESGGNYFTYLFVHDFLGRTAHTGVPRVLEGVKVTLACAHRVRLSHQCGREETQVAACARAGRGRL